MATGMTTTDFTKLEIPVRPFRMPVIVSDTQLQFIADAIADNRTVGINDWDEREQLCHVRHVKGDSAQVDNYFIALPFPTEDTTPVFCRWVHINRVHPVANGS